MPTSKSPLKSMDKYVAEFPINVRDVQAKLRRIIGVSTHEAEETTNYVMPTFKLKRNLGYFAANSANEVFFQELFPFEQVKGPVQIHCDNSIPFDLVEKIEV
jgi:uncharacterized protein YdhG (YjbR/CyaY superfamily)